MSAVIAELAGRLRLGAPVRDGGLAVVPVFGEFAGTPDFVTLEEAMSAGSLVVTEISEGGSVPALKALNRGAAGVLILDGEELVTRKGQRYVRPGEMVTGNIPQKVYDAVQKADTLTVRVVRR